MRTRRQDVGFNANLIRTSDGFWFANGFRHRLHRATPSNSRPPRSADSPIIRTTGRSVREVALEEYKKNPKVDRGDDRRCPSLHSIYPEFAYRQGNQWGMAIDLTTCTGCNACVVACQAENNSPVVGKDQVMRGREMHWIRMDRYYTGTEDEPRAVAATAAVHAVRKRSVRKRLPGGRDVASPEGLNDMAYNRCVGTRYCSNNCPFKVRHFNFLNFHKHEPALNLDGRTTRTSRCACAASWKSAPTACSAFRKPRSRPRAKAGAPIRRRNQDGLPADLPGRGDRVRQHQRSPIAGSRN